MNREADAFVIGLALFFVMCLLAFSAFGQDGRRENHDWLSKLTPKNGQGSCCSGDAEHGDCRVAQARQLHAWICEQGGFVYCFLKGGGGG